ncbi:MAG: aminodeoxychorismate/anthranilate synthase component II [Actinomycetota bacterium]
MILVVDHYDSFVYNLIQLVEAFGFETEVVRSDAEGAAALVGRRPDAVILSPGPGRPQDAGCMVELTTLLDARTPVLGVCLGHQAIGIAYGGVVARSPEPVHGKASSIHHTGEGIFAGLPNPFDGGRYHSLSVRDRDLPTDLNVTARTEDGVVMAVQHRTLRRFGVQFHPESILTPAGPRLIQNFLALVGAPSPPAPAARGRDVPLSTPPGPVNIPGR